MTEDPPDIQDPFETTDPKLKAFRLEVAEQQGSLLRKVRGAVTLVAILGAIVTPIGGFSVWLLREAKAQGADAGVRADSVRADFETHKKDSAQAHLQLKDDIHEVQGDIRALYKAVMTGARQERLERNGDGGR